MKTDKMTDMAKKPNFIVQRREELGISQEDLTARLQTEGWNIARSTLSNWENGKFQPPLRDKKFRTIFAKALRLSVRDLLERAGFEIVEPEHTDEAERAAFIMDQLPPSKRDIALGILEHFLETEAG